MNFLLIVLLFLSPLHTSGAESQPLPRAFQILELGGQFNTNSPQVHTFSDADGSLSYVWISPEDKTAVNVQLVKGVIARLAWHLIIKNPTTLDKKINKLKTTFQKHFIKKTNLDQGYALLFKDKNTHMVIRVEGTMVTWELISISSGLEVEL